MIARTAGTFATSGLDEAHLDFGGIPGDLHFGVRMRSGGRQAHYPRGTEIANYRQLSLVSQEELAEVAARLGLPVIKPEWLGANLLVSGIPEFTLLPAMTRLFFPGDLALALAGENQPCIHPGNLIQEAFPDRPGLAARFVQEAIRRRGVVGWVERPGSVRVGDKIRLALA